MVENNKLYKLITPTHKYSQLLQQFNEYIVRVEQFKISVEYQKSQTRRSVETLGLSGNGDNKIIAKK